MKARPLNIHWVILVITLVFIGFSNSFVLSQTDSNVLAPCEWVSDANYTLRDAVVEDQMQPLIPPRDQTDYQIDGTRFESIILGQQITFEGTTPARPFSWIVRIPYNPANNPSTFRTASDVEFRERTRPRLALIDQVDLEPERVHEALSNCTLPQWGAPPPNLLSIDALLDELGIVENWHAQGIRGQNVRVGIIDTRFDNLNPLLASNPDLNVTRVNILDELRVDADTTERDHGTNVLRILSAIAPEAEYFLARAITPEEFTAAVDDLLGASVNIIVHASNIITSQPAPYHDAVRRADAAGVLWINSAGNIGAGYYHDAFFETAAETGAYYHAFQDANRTEVPQRSLMIALNSQTGGQASVIWQRETQLEGEEETSLYINDFDMQLFLSPLLGNELGKSDATQFLPDSLLPAFESVSIPVGTVNSDNQTLPQPNYSLQSDGLVDNVLYLYLYAKDSAQRPQSGTPFEIFVEGALPAAYTPQIIQGLDPYVLVPADIAESLTVGAYDPITQQMAWYSSRFNSSQYAAVNSAFIKPDITTYGEIDFLDGTRFTGTSASTPIVGGIAALLASQPDFVFDAVAIRTLLTEQATQCLNDGAVGLRIGYLDLPAPSELTARQPLQCETYNWESDLAAQQSPGEAPEPPQVAITQPEEQATVTEEEFTIDINATGAGISRFVLDIALFSDDGQLGNWMPINVSLVDDTPYPDNVCSLNGQSAAGQRSITVNTLRFEPAESNILSDGVYILRLTACNDAGQPVASTQRIFILEKDGEPRIQIQNEDIASTSQEQPTKLTGVVILRGQARGDEFRNYLLQIGRGLQDEVTSWQTVVPMLSDATEDSPCALPQAEPSTSGSQPVWGRNEEMGSFDTTQFEDGIYTLRATLCNTTGEVAAEVTYAVEIDNAPAPFIAIDQPGLDTEITGSLVVSGRTGGDGHQGYALVLTRFDESGEEAGSRYVFPENTDGDVSIEAYCEDISNAVLNENEQRFTHSLPLSPNDNGDYQLRGYACAAGMVAFSTEAISLLVEIPLIPQKTLQLNPSDEPLTGDAVVLIGAIQHPELSGFTLEIAPEAEAGNNDVAWVLLSPVDANTEALPDDLCDLVGEEIIRNVDGVLLDNFDTTQLSNGRYVIRLTACLINADPEYSNVVTQAFEIDNPAEAAILYPEVGQEVSGPLTILGTVWAPAFEQYTLELRGEGDASWLTLVGPRPTTDTQTVEDDLCTLLPNQNDLSAVLGLNTIENSPLSPSVNTREYANGAYTLRLRACQNGVTVSEWLTEFTINNADPLPTLSLLQPQDGATVDSGLNVIGSAFGEGYRGYVVEIAEEASFLAWQIVAPEALIGETLEDPCMSANLPANIAEETNAPLYRIEPQSRPQGNYLLRVRLCVETESGVVQTARQLERRFANVNPQFEFDVSANAFAERINIVGTITAPDFVQYFIEIAPNDPNLAEDEWQTIVGPNGLNDATLQGACSLGVDATNLGAYRIENETIAVIQQAALRPGIYRLRATVCRSQNAPFRRTFDDFIEITALPTQTQGPQVSVLGETSINMRLGPSEDYEIISQLPGGSTAVLRGRSSDNRWYNIAVEGLTNGAWVQSSEVFAYFGTFDVATIPVIDAPVAGTGVPDTVLFASDVTGTWQIYRLTTASGEIVQLTFQGNNEFPELSPGGQTIAFASDRDGNREIYVMDINGENVRNLTQNTAEDYRPSWSPDGETLLFESTREGERRLYAMLIATGQITMLSPNLGAPCCVDWSSNGRQIVFSARISDNYDIFVINLDGTGLVNLTNAPGDDINPAWQPNGSTIVFESNRTGIAQIYSVQIDGSNFRSLTQGENESIQPSWTPDGSQILFSSFADGYFQLFIMTADGVNPRSLVGPEGDETGGDAN
jgi:TolB protein